MLLIYYCRSRSLRRQITKWGWDRPSQQVQPSIIHDEQLKHKVEVLWRMNFTHRKMLRALTEFEGYTSLSSSQLKKIRLENVYIRVNRSAMRKQIAREAAIQQVCISLYYILNSLLTLGLCYRSSINFNWPIY